MAHTVIQGSSDDTAMEMITWPPTRRMVTCMSDVCRSCWPLLNHQNGRTSISAELLYQDETDLLTVVNLCSRGLGEREGKGKERRRVRIRGPHGFSSALTVAGGPEESSRAFPCPWAKSSSAWLTLVGERLAAEALSHVAFTYSLKIQAHRT